MSTPISAAAASARESARADDGRFGTQHRSEAELDLQSALTTDQARENLAEAGYGHLADAEVAPPDDDYQGLSFTRAGTQSWITMDASPGVVSWRDAHTSDQSSAGLDAARARLLGVLPDEDDWDSQYVAQSVLDASERTLTPQVPGQTMIPGTAKMGDGKDKLTAARQRLAAHAKTKAAADALDALSDVTAGEEGSQRWVESVEESAKTNRQYGSFDTDDDAREKLRAVAEMDRQRRIIHTSPAARAVREITGTPAPAPLERKGTADVEVKGFTLVDTEGERTYAVPLGKDRPEGVDPVDALDVTEAMRDVRARRELISAGQAGRFALETYDDPQAEAAYESSMIAAEMRAVRAMRRRIATELS